MKKNSSGLLVLILVTLAAACAPESWIKVNVEIPGAAVVKLNLYREIVLAGFWQEKEPKDFNLNQALLGYFQDEMKSQFQGKLAAKMISWENAETIDNKNFWKHALPDSRDRLILTGKVDFSQDVRKALRLTGRRAIDDGPFEPEKAWLERKNFSLKLDVYLINADTGEILFRKDFLESILYENQMQSSEFAFFDLLQRVKLKLFRLLFGSDRLQERYLLSK